jgi:hypothetical protein
MFDVSGFLKTLGIVLLITITISFIMGFFNIGNITLFLLLMYSCTYILNGILAPIWNSKTPYFASYLSSITLTVFNLLFAFFVLDIMVFLDPVEINRGLVLNSTLSLLATLLTLKILKKKTGDS